MKILIIRNFPSYMSVEKNTYNIQEVGLAKALVRKGHKCDIVFWTDKKEKDISISFDEGKIITVFYRHSKVILKNAIYKNLERLISQYDIIQPCEYNQLQSWILAKKYPDKTVIFHGPYYSEFNKRYNTLCRFMDVFLIPTYRKLNTRFIVKSNLAKEFLINKGIKNENITTIGVGIDLDALTNDDLNDIPNEIREVSTFENELKLLYIGRMEPRRNIPFLFDILKNLTEKNIDVKLILIGSGNKEYVENCFEHAKTLGVDSSVYWVEKAEQKYLPYVYKNTDIFLLPTQYEIFGMVLLEAMYFDKTVLTTLNGGSEMLIANDVDGIIMDEFDADKWCKKIIENMGNSEIGKNAGCKISGKFTWDVLVDKFADVYQKRLIK